MIDARSFHNECRRKINRINTGFSQHVKVPDLDEYINEALYTWHRNNSAKVEINSETRNDLRIFEIKNRSLEFENMDDRVVSKFPQDFYKMLNQKVIGVNDKCSERTINVRVLQSGEINDLVYDPYWEPSFEWMETIGDEANDGFHIWHNNKFEVKQVVVDYIRKPKEVRCPSLMKEGFYTIGTKRYENDSPMELDPERAHEVSDLVALFVARDISDSQEYQSQIDKILRKDNNYTN